jgi:protein-disulfide isomerase
VGWYKANMEEHKISGTPSFVIDGEMVSNRSYDELSALLDEKLGS